jgi:hypothetical protein
MKSLLFSPDQAEQTVLPKVLELRAMYASLYTEMLEHFCEEETFWPPVIESKGEVYFVIFSLLLIRNNRFFLAF